MNLTIRKWRIDDKSDLAINLNNLKVLNNLIHDYALYKKMGFEELENNEGTVLMRMVLH